MILAEYMLPVMALILEQNFYLMIFLDKLKNAILNSSTVPQNLFINIFVDSDDDETPGF